MLYWVPRLGSLFPDLNVSTFRKTALGLTAAAAMAVMGTSTLGTFPAAAQQLGQPYSAEQCRNAKIIIGSVYDGYARKGGLSKEFVDGVNGWALGGCQGPIKTVAMVDNDEAAFGEIRVRLIAMRSQASAQPASFSN